MIARRRSIEQLVDEQVKKWDLGMKEQEEQPPAISVLTVSREPGSGGKLIAKGIAECINFDLFHQEVIHEMAQSAKVSARMLESLDEKGLSMLEDWVAAVVNQHYLWPDEYLQHLLKVVSTIGKHGNAVLVGRGANFILPLEKTLRIRVIAPQSFRAKKVAEQFDLPLKEAERRILKTESDRRAFVRKYFYADIDDPNNYDLVINTGSISLTEAIEGVCHILKIKSAAPRRNVRTFEVS
jgi:cytidylate kinase